MKKYCQMDFQYIRTNRKTGKEYKTWEFCGWYTLPDLTKVEHVIKGKYAILKGSDGLERYDLEDIIEK
jgi:hypothetical protein